MHEELSKIIQADLLQKNLNRDLLLKIIDKIEEIETLKGWDLSDLLPRADKKINKVTKCLIEMKKNYNNFLEIEECHKNKE